MTQKEQQALNGLMRSAIQRVAVGPNRGRDLESEECERLMNGILNDVFDPVQVAVLLIGLRMKHESSNELAGIFSAMQSSVSVIDVDVENLLCMADPFDGYTRHLPMSPFLPAVLASCGLPSLIHGVESVGPKHGITAGKVYRAAGMKIAAAQDPVARSIEMNGWGYIEQDVYLPKLATLNDLRDRMVKRTALTTLERVVKPFRARSQTWFVLGYVHSAYPQIYAEIARQAGYQKCLLFKGVEGGLTVGVNKPQRAHFFDFISNLEAQKVSESPYRESLKHQAAPNENDLDVAVNHCLDLGMDVLGGKSHIGRDSLVLSAANILLRFGVSAMFSQAVEKVENCLDNGSAKDCFISQIDLDA